MSKQFFAFGNDASNLAGGGDGNSRWGEPAVRVKFMHRGLEKGRSFEGFLRQFPDSFPQWGNCLFDFDVDCTDYDWLVVYQDLPRSGSFFTEEKLCCPRERTMLITGEPSTITVFGRDYLRQFGCILTFQEPWAMNHPNVIFHHPGLIWHYGLPFDKGKFRVWNEIAAAELPDKPKLLSTVCSQRTGKVTLHSARVEFTWRLKEEIPELDIFGHGVNPMNDKAEVLDPYRFHIAVENHVYNHHLTEKLPDAFLGFTLPFYHGAPNATDYFPKESFIPVDINDYRRTKEIIQFHLANNEYPDRLPYIKEARRRVLHDQNLFAIISRQINEQEKRITSVTPGKVVRNRSTLRIKNPLVGCRSLLEKASVKTYHRLTARSRTRPRKI
ncbi:glycosyltransferase family 10 domain-containing protein [Desulforhopalus singaporensis]|uniref:glycosyltransferase family 10 domain-containing protein n=1 Tax=Desulforhopalus singaporensis TaxID=91360 RepID=UPI001C409FD9|nr:glycosyltransferase family 10 [Desulforhopalus singaporensis]